MIELAAGGDGCGLSSASGVSASSSKGITLAGDEHPRLRLLVVCSLLFRMPTTCVARVNWST